MKYVVLLLILFCGSCSHAPPTQDLQPPFADIHLHYNWDQKEIIDPATVIERLKAENVVLGVVSSVPSHYALTLRQAAGDWIVPLFSPYITPLHRQSWYLDKAVVEQARAGLESKQYYGIGELHLWSGLPPRRDNDVLLGLFDLAKEFKVPVLLHTETSDADYIVPLCRRYQQVRILWAHAGGKLGPAEVEKAMVACSNLWVELSARDPWRYDSLLDGSGKLPSAWIQLITKYSSRFMTGSDPVWAVTRTQRWDQADDGWDHLHKLIQFHRNWLSQLPPDVERKVRLDNARAFFPVRSQDTR